MSILKREEILAAKDLREERVEVAEWGNTIILREMSAARRIRFEKALKDDDESIRWAIVAWCAVDEQGELLFTAADMPALAGKSFDVIKRLSDVAFRVNALRRQDVQDAKVNF